MTSALLSSALAGNISKTIGNNIPTGAAKNLGAAHYSHWSQHLAVMSALTMTITAVATAILAMYALTAVCALSAVTHLVAGYFIGKFLVYRDFEALSNELQQRLNEMTQNEQKLKDANQSLTIAEHKMHAELAEHEAFAKDIQQRFGGEIAGLTQAADKLEMIKLVSAHLKDAALKISQDSDKITQQIQAMEAALKAKDAKNQLLSTDILTLEQTLDQLKQQLNASDQEKNKIAQFLTDFKEIKAKTPEFSDVEMKAQKDQMNAAADKITQLKAEIKSLNQTITQQKAEIAALKTNTLYPNSLKK